jgi:phosphopantothenoylcysteine decarboxylase/phosphopantothenate--cysteine ligase
MYSQRIAQRATTPKLARQTIWYTRRMNALHSKRILLGVSGGIAAYKSADLVRRLREAGAQVRVVMTRSAVEFVQPLTFQALSGNPVRSELWDPDAEAAMGHIELARWADAVLIAPASANTMARLALGIADDLLSTLCLACEAPIAVAPAMNRVMWANPATQANRQRLIERGVRVLGPASGDQACGEQGEGRMLEPVELAGAMSELFRTGALAGLQVLVTAGPTREAIDPVRFMSNRSSGRMGFAIAQAAAEAGASVRLISGPASLPTPAGVERDEVETALEMLEAVQSHLASCNIFVGAAAVSDYRVEKPAASKIKKSSDQLSLTLTRNPDIIAHVASARSAPFTVGFAAETEDPRAFAERKLAEKGLDMIAANRVGVEGEGFESETNALEVIWADGHRTMPLAPKDRIARQLIALIAQRYAVQRDKD